MTERVLEVNRAFSANDCPYQDPGALPHARSECRAVGAKQIRAWLASHVIHVGGHRPPLQFRPIENCIDFFARCKR